VTNAGDLRNALVAAKNQGKRDVLLKVKAEDATKFVAVPLAQKAG
jgi:serine protease Do